MLSVAAFSEGKCAQAFPSFGSERTGAPVMSFCRIDDHQIRSREPVLEPDALIIQDPSLLHVDGIFSGLNPKGVVLINSSHDVSELGIDALVKRLPRGHVVVVPATELAMKFIKRPLPNAVMLGGFAAIGKVVKIDSILETIAETFKGAIGEANIAAAKAAYEAVSAQQKELRAC